MEVIEKPGDGVADANNEILIHICDEDDIFATMDEDIIIRDE